MKSVLAVMLLIVFCKNNAEAYCNGTATKMEVPTTNNLLVVFSVNTDNPCLWHFKTPNSSYGIFGILTALDIDIYNYMRFYEGDNESGRLIHDIGPLCFGTTYLKLASIQTLYLKSTADGGGDTSHMQWRFFLIAVKDYSGQNCRGGNSLNLTATPVRQLLSSPSAPYNYGRGLHCEWIIDNGGTNLSIHLQLIYAKTNTGDIITVKNTRNTNLLTHNSDRFLNGSYVDTGFYISFVSDATSHDYEQGFLFSYWLKDDILLGGACNNKVHVCADTNAECTGGVCICKDGFYDSNGASFLGNCTANRLLHESCDSIRKCDDANAECPNASSVCMCKNTHYDDNGREAKGVCKQRSAVGEVCSSIILCMSPTVQCVSGKCSCPGTNFHVSNGDCLADAYTQEQKQGYTAAVVVGSVCTFVLPAIAIMIYRCVIARKTRKRKQHKTSYMANKIQTM